MKQIFTTALVLSRMIAYAQTEEDFYKRVGINTTQPRAGLEVKAYTFDGRAQGILFPHISEAEKSIWTTDELKGLVKGTVIWNTTKNCLDYFNGTTWQCTDGTKKNTHPTTWFDVDILELTAGAFAGRYKDGISFNTANTVKFKLKNNGTEAISNLNLTNAVTIANGTATITATGENANAVNIPVGGEVEVTYTLSGEPEEGILTATFSYENKTVSANTPVASGFDVTLPVGLTIGDGNHIIASIYDEDYLPFTAPTVGDVASWDSEPAGGGTETLIDLQGTIPAAGITVQIPITYTGTTVNLPALASYEVAIHSKGEQGITNSTRTLVLSWSGQSISTATKYITATIKPADGQELKVKKLDLNTGFGGDYKGTELAKFKIPESNGSTTKVSYTVRVMPGIPDRNYGDGKHDFIYLPVVAEDGKVWLNNNLGAAYANTKDTTNFNPTQQATSRSDDKSFGSLFQWQRQADGHELITWDPSNNYKNSIKSNSVFATIDADWVAPANDTNFYHHNTYPYSWVSSTYNGSNHTYWRSGGQNNPCPSGFHVPTNTEWTNLQTKAGASASHNYDWWATTSMLRLPSPGMRYNGDGELRYQTNAGYYWTSESHVANYNSYYFGVSNGGSNSSVNYDRSIGFSVRCLQD